MQRAKSLSIDFSRKRFSEVEQIRPEYTVVNRTVYNSFQVMVKFLRLTIDSKPKSNYQTTNINALHGKPYRYNLFANTRCDTAFDILYLVLQWLTPPLFAGPTKTTVCNNCKTALDCLHISYNR